MLINLVQILPQRNKVVNTLLYEIGLTMKDMIKYLIVALTRADYPILIEFHFT